MKTRLFSCLIVIGVGLSACKRHTSDSSQDVPPSQQMALVAGTYIGTYLTSTVPTSDLRLTINQNGINLTGSMSGHGGAFVASMTGTVGTETFTFTVTETQPCSGSFNGSCAINGNNLSGFFNGSDCDGSQTGSFSVTKS